MILLEVEQRIKLDGLTIKFLDVVEESRCPVGWTCDNPGSIRVKLEIIYNNKEKEEIIIGMGDKDYELESYQIKLVNVLPVRHDFYPIFLKNYQITIYVFSRGPTRVVI